MKSMQNLKYTDQHSFLSRKYDSSWHSRLFKELLHKTFLNSMEDLKNKNKDRYQLFLEKQFQILKRLRSLILSKPCSREGQKEFWGIPTLQNYLNGLRWLIMWSSIKGLNQVLDDVAQLVRESSPAQGQRLDSGSGHILRLWFDPQLGSIQEQLRDLNLSSLTTPPLPSSQKKKKRHWTESQEPQLWV